MGCQLRPAEGEIAEGTGEREALHQDEDNENRSAEKSHETEGGRLRGGVRGGTPDESPVESGG